MGSARGETRHAVKDFHCRDAGMNCDWTARGETPDEIMKAARVHAEQVHHLKVTGELASKLTGLIHDENSEAHRRALQGGSART